MSLQNIGIQLWDLMA